jgi:hypothetical protein
MQAGGREEPEDKLVVHLGEGIQGSQAVLHQRGNST